MKKQIILLAIVIFFTTKLFCASGKLITPNENRCTGADRERMFFGIETDSFFADFVARGRDNCINMKHIEGGISCKTEKLMVAKTKINNVYINIKFNKVIVRF